MPWSGIFHHTQFYWSGIDFCLRQETSEEDTEADESFVSTDAEGIPHHEETRGCEVDVNKDQDVDQQGVTDEDAEEVSKEVRGEAMEAIETADDLPLPEDPDAPFHGFPVSVMDLEHEPKDFEGWDLTTPFR